ncbi:MAG: tetratricopeptide repeat protein [Candidatus Kapabacteria bacterium]|nr:tetratricopeptide repeat protein [Candidatus Kapabacteria bacterium]
MKQWMLMIAVAMLCNTAILNAGEITYKVLCSTGDVQIQNEPSQPFAAAKVNNVISKNATVRIGAKGGYCCVLGSDGHTQEFMKPGAVKLSATDGKPVSGTMQTIVGFLETSMKNPTGKRYVGSVYRSVGRSSIVFPYDTRVLDDTIELVWHAEQGERKYQLQMKDDKNSVLLKRTVADTSIKLNLTTVPTLQRGSCVYWNASTQTNPSTSSYALCWASKPEADSLRDEFTKFKNQERGTLDPERSPIAAMLCGAWYERAGYFAEALKYYNKAYKMQPDAAPFRNAMNTLLARLGGDGR